jgi:transposase
LCWAHQRRDFIEAERGRPELHVWASAWLARIAALYRLNAARLAVWQREPVAFAAADQELRAAVASLAQARAEEQARADLAPPCRKILEGRSAHWAGLTVFVEHPEVPLDNNGVERAERGPLVGRKNDYGSGAVWAGQLAAVLFSVFETLKLWGLNAQQWLTSYLSACADAGGRAPAHLRRTARRAGGPTVGASSSIAQGLATPTATTTVRAVRRTAADECLPAASPSQVARSPHTVTCV